MKFQMMRIQLNPGVICDSQRPKISYFYVRLLQQARIWLVLENTERISAAGQKINENGTMEQTVTLKTVQDQYKPVEDQLDKNINEQVFFSGVAGGEMGYIRF